MQIGPLDIPEEILTARLVLALIRHCDTVEPWNLSQLQTVILRLHREGADGQLIRELLEKYLEPGGLDDQDLTDIGSSLAGRT